MDDIDKVSIDETRQKKLDTEDLYWKEVKGEYDYETIVFTIADLMIIAGDNPSYKTLDKLFMTVADLIPVEMWEVLE
tara:strand:+ start:322 stop:552 length:231 start_codon:yes stop_codon:yes gene_type:complete